MTSMENLPGEILSEIFIRLLAKKVAQMRSICKPWNALLSESSFIKSHLHRSIQNNNNDDILLFFELSFDFQRTPKPFRACPSRSPNLELTNFIKHPAIFECKYGFGRFIGSVNGLICFLHESSRDGIVLHIWNPSLSSILSLPQIPFGSYQLCSAFAFAFAFGFDPKTDDYKIVKLTSFSPAPYKVAKEEVYSMRKGSWKLITPQTFPSHITIPEGHNNQVCVDDNLHWLYVYDTDLELKPQTIVGFDLGEEAFIEIPLPETILDFKLYKPYNVLGVLGGKLCVMSRVIDGKWEVWMMVQYGVAKSWVKHHVFSQFSGDIVPYGFTSHGHFLYQVGVNDDRFALYDPVASKTKTFKIKSRYYSKIKFVEYVDSLVWVPPPKRETEVSNFFKLNKKTIIVLVCMIPLLPRLKPLRHHFYKYLFGS